MRMFLFWLIIFFLWLAYTTHNFFIVLIAILLIISALEQHQSKEGKNSSKTLREVTLNKRGFRKVAPPKSERSGKPYSLSTKRSLLTRSERAFYLELQKQLPPHKYQIWIKTRLADIIQEDNNKWAVVKELLPKHIDFVIVDNSFKPLLAIEVDGFSHLDKKQRAKDMIKNELLYLANLPLVRVQVGSNFKQVISDILQQHNML